MRAVSRRYGIPDAAVRAAAAGTDLLCLGRDQDEESYLAVRHALCAAVATGQLPAARLEEAAARVADLRAWLAQAGSAAGHGAQAGEGAEVGLRAARRALRTSGTVRPLTDPVVIEVSARENIAVGGVPWGLGPWLPAAAVQRVPASLSESGVPALADAILAGAAGRPVVVVVRDAHRYPVARALVTRVLEARPDAVVVEMGLPLWRPPAGLHIATYGAAHTNAQAAAEILGLAKP
jgi:beta-N-acetylhexosaminidase